MCSLNVPCILVDNTNLNKWWPSIKETLAKCDFISIDLELSGLGSRDLYSTQIDERYKALKEVASTRAILSIGLSCFKIHPTNGFFMRKKFKSELEKVAYEQVLDCLEDGTSSEESRNEDYYVTVNVFNFICLCGNEFIMESKSMKFLAMQGFDFNELSKTGICYYRGNDPCFEDSKPSLRGLLSEIIALELPIIVHNGLLDIAFLYQNLYADLPEKLEKFVSDLSEMFPRGIFDTKYIANSCLSFSYLEYLFNYSQRKNYFRKIKNQPSLNIEFNEFTEEFIGDIRYFDLSAKILQQSADKAKICDNYAKYGWCEKLDYCEKSHNIDLILDEEIKSKKDKKSKLLVSHLKKLNWSNSGNDPNNFQPIPMRKCGSHHSGNDAFMTGYYFLFYLITNFNKTTYNEFKKYYENLTKFKNKIFLSGKLHPLNIMQSSFSSTSKSHKDKIQKIKDAKEKQLLSQ